MMPTALNGIKADKTPIAQAHAKKTIKGVPPRPCVKKEMPSNVHGAHR